MSEVELVMAAARVAEAAAASETAASRLRVEVVRAHGMGVAVTDLADAARVGRQTIYRWLAAVGSEERPRPAAAIREALRIMLPYLDAYQMEQVSRRMGSRDVEQLLTALKMARTWLPLNAAREMGEDERVAIGLATEAENHIRAARAAGRAVDAGDSE